jgi:hypothetical protein
MLKVKSPMTASQLLVPMNLNGGLFRNPVYLYYDSFWPTRDLDWLPGTGHREELSRRFRTVSATVEMPPWCALSASDRHASRCNPLQGGIVTRKHDGSATQGANCVG